MANEAVCIEAPKIIVRRTVANGTAIIKGRISVLTDPNTAGASSAADQPFAGIAIEGKTISDGIIEIGHAIDGVWDMKATSAAITIGAAVAVGGANLIVAADAADLLNGAFIGYAEEAFSNDEVARVRLRGY